MGFVYEKVPEADKDFWLSLGIKNCWGAALLHITPKSVWCADRERNAYLIGVGGGMHDVPQIFDFWWNGDVVRLEIDDYNSSGNRRENFRVVWNINKISIPESVWKSKDGILLMIKEAFSLHCDSVEVQNVESIDVNINCSPVCLNERK